MSDDFSAIFLTEPMLTRALAAEIRHDPKRLLALLSDRCIGDDLGLGKAELRSVKCESDANLDVLLVLERGTGETRVGIEAKLDHALSVEQIVKENEAVDLLFLLVLEEVDAGDFASLVSGVVSWRDVLECFDQSRLTLEDIDNLPPQKVAIERMMRRLTPGLKSKVGDGWLVDVGRGGSGMPAIVFRSPQLSDGRQLRGQVQVSGRGMPASADDLRFEYHVGIETRAERKDFPDAEKCEKPPGWIKHLEVLRDEVVGADPAKFRIRVGHSSNGRRGVGRNKTGLVKKFLPGSSWIAAGYFDWALGPKSVQVHASELSELADAAAELFKSWFTVANKDEVDKET